MVSKAELKTYASYKLLKNRDTDGVFIVEGVKMVQELLKSSYIPIKICATKEWIYQNPDIGMPVIEISESELNRISLLQAPNQVWALVRKKQNTLLSVDWDNSLQLVLDEIKDPGNMGTLIRTADWFGFSQIFCAENSVDVYNPKVVQASMGSVFRVSVYAVALDTFLQNIPLHVKVYGAMLEGENIYSSSLDSTGIIIIGNESKGISDKIKPYVTHPLSIPCFHSKAESLNAAVAAGIICSEFRRKQF